MADYNCNFGGQNVNIHPRIVTHGRSWIVAMGSRRVTLIRQKKPRANLAEHGYDAETIQRLLTEGVAPDDAR